MGPNCNSWGLPARGTSKRSYINAFGAMHFDFVHEGNTTISRTLVVCMVLIVFDVFFFGWIINHHVPSYPSSIFDEWEPYEPRLTLVCLLIMAKHCYFVLEQPASSLLARHPRWEWFCNRICYVP